MAEQYRGFTISYVTGQFAVVANVRNGRHRIEALQAFGTTIDDARLRIRRQIDFYLTGETR